MSRFDGSAFLGNLKGMVILIIGGANGVGSAFVKKCDRAGAIVYFGDVDEKAGANLKGSLSRRATFVPTYISNYESLLQLFNTALSGSGRVNSAVCCSGITEIGNWFDPALDLDSVRQLPSSRVLDGNLLGPLYFSRIAYAYLRQNKESASDKSITLISSVAGFKESPGLFVYQASKHGVLGLMRSLRTYLPELSGIRVNAVCPWMTRTVMTKSIETAWQNAQLPANEPEDVAKVIAEICALSSLNGKAIYVEGGRAWEIEDNIDRLEPQWLGEEASRTLNEGQIVLGKGEGLSTEAK